MADADLRGDRAKGFEVGDAGAVGELGHGAGAEAGDGAEEAGGKVDDDIAGVLDRGGGVENGVGVGDEVN